MTNNAQKILPHLWFDTHAEEAAKFYTSLFANSHVGGVARYGKEGFEIHGQPEGTVMAVDFDLGGYRMVGINGGPLFKFTPAISLFVMCESEQEIDDLWRALSDGGTALMALDKYEWSERYGWIMDRYGLTWQLFMGSVADAGQKISPCLMYVGDQHGKATEAMQLYTSTFENSSIVAIDRYGENEGMTPGTVKHARFLLEGELFRAMDAGVGHAFTFTEAVSLFVACDSQQEIDRIWDSLSSGGDPDAQQCGWLKDRYGVSWQVAPRMLSEMTRDPDAARVARVTNAFLEMKKLDMATIERAYAGE